MSSQKKWSKHFEMCSRCKSTSHSHKAKGLCTLCYQKEHLYPLCQCSICGYISRVHKRVNGKAICSKCYKEPIHTCSICSKETTAAYKLSCIDFVCDSCYAKHYRKKQLCSICNNLGVLAINNENTKVCVKCYPIHNNSCSKCGRNVKSPYVIDGNHVCSRCYENAKKDNLFSRIDINKEIIICSVCGKPNVIQRLYNDNSVVCPNCFKEQVCHSCNNPVLPIHSHINGLPYCRGCYYKQKYLNIFIKLRENWNESFTKIIEEYFHKRSLKVSFEAIWEQIRFLENLLNDLNTDYTNNSFKFSTSSFVEKIKKYPLQKPSINSLISFLSLNNLLPEYYSGLILVDNLSDQINMLPIMLRKIIIEYKEELIIKFIKYQEKGWINSNLRFSYYTCYVYLLTALRFFKFINTILSIEQPTEINNHIVDNYIRIKQYERGNLRHFITYLNKNKVTFMQLILPHIKYLHDLNTGISHERQLQILDSCLYKNDNLLRDRILVLLMLLYGTTPESIRTLKKSNFYINKSKNTEQVVFYANMVKQEIPKIFSSLILEHCNSIDEFTEFIFPGRYVNTPLSNSSICRILKKFNVTATELHYTAVNNAMINGLYQPALLMKSFGINYITATRYYSIIKGSMEF